MHVAVSTEVTLPTIAKSTRVDIVATAHLGDLLIRCLCDIALFSFACGDLDCLAAMTTGN
jgi:hypothetical protein